MGSHGGSSPNGLTQREARTLFLRVPAIDWPKVSQGSKTEFRTLPIGATSKAFHGPTPVVAYVAAPRQRTRTMIMLLLNCRRERLVDIADKPGSLAREGMASYDDFRRYWRRRTARPYRPLQEVDVFTLSQWPKDQLAIDQLGRHLLTRLYGDYLPDAADDL